MSLATGGTGGIYYPLGGALTRELSIVDSTRQYTAEVTGGSVENVNRIRERQVDLAFALAVSAFEAFRRDGGGGGVLRTVAPLYPNLTHVMVRRGFQGTGIADFRGARVSVGAAGSGTEQVSRQLLEAHGLTYDDLDARYLSFSESAAAIADGAIDAAILSVGYPAAAVLEATTTAGARLLPIDAQSTGRLRESYPYYTAGVIPSGVYPGVSEPVPTAAVMNWVVAHVDLDDEVVEAVLHVLSDRRAQLESVHDMAAQISLDLMSEPPVPLHPAAERWWTSRSGG